MFFVKLEIEECDIGKHDGMYNIHAKNEGGQASCSVQVNLKRNLHFNTIKNFVLFFNQLLK
jgi:hypothetical protein